MTHKIIIILLVQSRKEMYLCIFCRALSYDQSKTRVDGNLYRSEQDDFFLPAAWLETPLSVPSAILSSCHLSQEQQWSDEMRRNRVAHKEWLLPTLTSPFLLFVLNEPNLLTDSRGHGVGDLHGWWSSDHNLSLCSLLSSSFCRSLPVVLITVMICIRSQTLSIDRSSIYGIDQLVLSTRKKI